MAELPRCVCIAMLGEEAPSFSRRQGSRVEGCYNWGTWGTYGVHGDRKRGRCIQFTGTTFVLWTCRFRGIFVWSVSTDRSALLPYALASGGKPWSEPIRCFKSCLAFSILKATVFAVPVHHTPYRFDRYVMYSMYGSCICMRSALSRPDNLRYDEAILWLYDVIYKSA